MTREQIGLTPRQTQIEAMLIALSELNGEALELKTEELYAFLHRLNEKLPHGMALTRDGGNMNLLAAANRIRESNPTQYAQIYGLVTELIARANMDPQLSGLGTQPHEEW